MKHVPDVRVNNFDLIRLAAAGQVVWEHGVEHLGGGTTVPAWDWLLQAVPGVPVFFLVSGFLISLSYERAGSLRRYVQNRFLRIYPGLWVCLAVSVMSVIALAGLDWRAIGVGRVGAWSAAQLTLGQFYNPSWLRGYGVGVLNGSLWTIPVELQFYAALPFLYRLLGLGSERRRNAPLLVTIAAFWAIGLGVTMARGTYGGALWYKLIGVTFLPYFYLFLLGVLVQRNWGRIGGWVAGRGWWWLGGYAILASLMHLGGLTVGTNTPNPLGVLPLAGLVFALAFSGPTLADRLLRRNDLSYGVYIYHMPVINAFVALGLTGTLLLTVPVAAVTALLAALSWALVERPALRFKQTTVHAVSLA